MNKTIQIHVDWKKKTLTMIEPQNIPLEIDEAGNCIIDEEMLKAKVRTAYESFEEDVELLLTVEQEIRLYRYLGTALSIMMGRTADVVKIDKKLAKTIILLAQEYGFLYEGNNYSWKINKDTKSRWIERAKEKEYYLQDPNTISRVPSTPQESLDRLERMSTPEQKAKARGEAYIKKDIEEEEEEVPTEVIHEQLYSPAKEAKEKEKKARDEQAKRDSEEYKRKANSKEAQPVVPKCIRVLGVIEEKEKDKPKKQKK